MQTPAHLGTCIFYWGDVEQRHLLLQGLRPWALEAARRGLADRLWYCHFDARGPHVFALFTSTAALWGELRTFLGTCIEGFLQRWPSQAQISPDELERRHRQCRGKTLCAIHAEDGLASNNSFVLFEHEPDGYPLRLSAGMSAEGEFWRRMGELSAWTLSQLERGPRHAVALRWLMAVDAALRRSGLPRERYWRLHATSLIPSLTERLETEEPAVRDSLPRAIGARNQETFAHVRSACAPEALGFDVEGLVETILADDGRPLPQRLGVLREVNHCLLLQLGHKVKVHVPMVLYSWQQSLSA